MRYFTADLHFGHENICRYTGRPYRCVGEMNDDLVARWNATVGDDDEVWVLGDLAMGPVSDSLRLANMLAGRKVLVPGNHDRCWQHAKAKERARWLPEYEAAGFEIVNAPSSIRIRERQVMVDHFPYCGDSQDGEDRYAECRPVDRGDWLLHGHIHGLWRQRGRMIDVGIDAWGGHLVNEETVAAMIEAGPEQRPPLRWRDDTGAAS